MSIVVNIDVICDFCGKRRVGELKGGVEKVMDKDLWDILPYKNGDNMITDYELGEDLIFCSDECNRIARKQRGLSKFRGGVVLA